MTTQGCFGGPVVYRTGKMPSISLVIKMQQKEMFEKAAKLFAQAEMKKLLVRMVITNIIHMTNTMGNILQQDTYYKHIESYKIFEWSLESFYERMNSNIKYINLLRKEHPRTLCISKMITDLANLEGLLKLLYDGWLGLAFKEIESCQNLLTVREDLELSYKCNSKVLARLEKQYHTFELYEKRAIQAKCNQLNDTIDRHQDMELVLGPTYRRHKRDSQFIHHEFLEHEMSQAEHELEKEYERLTIKIHKDILVNDSVLAFYDSETEHLKERLVYWNCKYEADNEQATNEVTKRKLALQHLKRKWDNCIERIEFFRSEINRIEVEKFLQEEKMAAEMLLQAAKDAMLIKEQRRKDKIKLKKNVKNGKNGKTKQRKKK